MERRSLDPILDFHVTCPSCGYSIPPFELVLVTPETVRCPNCERSVILEPQEPS